MRKYEIEDVEKKDVVIQALREVFGNEDVINYIAVHGIDSNNKKYTYRVQLDGC